MTIRRDDAAAFHVLNRELGLTLAEPAYGFVFEDGAGAFAFNNYSGANIELTIWARGRLGLKHVRAIARLAFEAAKARRITVHTRTSNKKAQNACKALGFRYEGRAEDFYEDEHAERYALLAREQRLIKL